GLLDRGLQRPRRQHRQLLGGPVGEGRNDLGRQVVVGGAQPVQRHRVVPGDDADGDGLLIGQAHRAPRLPATACSNPATTRAVSATEKSRLRRTPASASLVRNAGSAMSRSSAAANATGSPGATSNPSTPSRTISVGPPAPAATTAQDRKSTRLNSSHV